MALKLVGWASFRAVYFFVSSMAKAEVSRTNMTMTRSSNILKVHEMGIK